MTGYIEVYLVNVNLHICFINCNTIVHTTGVTTMQPSSHQGNVLGLLQMHQLNGLPPVVRQRFVRHLRGQPGSWMHLLFGHAVMGQHQRLGVGEGRPLIQEQLIAELGIIHSYYKSELAKVPPSYQSTSCTTSFLPFALKQCRIVCCVLVGKRNELQQIRKCRIALPVSTTQQCTVFLQPTPRNPKGISYWSSRYRSLYSFLPHRPLLSAEKHDSRHPANSATVPCLD